LNLSRGFETVSIGKSSRRPIPRLCEGDWRAEVTRRTVGRRDDNSGPQPPTAKRAGRTFTGGYRRLAWWS